MSSLPDYVICGHCHGLRGPTGQGWTQLCACATKEERAANEPATRRDLSTAVVLCKCCGLRAVPTGSRWAHFVCEACKERIIALNRSAGRCVIPIGYHSIVNGVSLNGAAASPEAATAFSDQLVALFREQGGIWAWGERVVLSNLVYVGLPTSVDVSLEVYLDAVARSRLSPAIAFWRLRRAISGRDFVERDS